MLLLLCVPCLGAQKQVSIAESNLPQPHLIYGRSTSFLAEHAAMVTTILMVILVLLLLVSILAINLIRLRKTQAALQESEAMFRTVFEHSAVGMAQVDAQNGKFLRVNNRLGQILGRSKDDLLRLTYADVTHPDDLAHDVEQMQRMASGELEDYTCRKRYLQQNGGVVWASLSVAPFGTNGGRPEWYVAVIQDITAVKEAEDQLIKSERLSAVGQLSAGIAHEFNNMLMIILGYTDLLKTQRGEFRDVGETCDIISKQVVRGRDIVSQMMTLANPSPLHMGPVKVNELIENVLQIQAVALGNEQIEVVRNYGPDVTIRGDRQQLNQVLTSLIGNARHAIRPKGKGRITIQTAIEDSHLELRVSDTGIGMTEEVKNKMFTPFFTTKGGFSNNNLGLKGSGLALCVCLRVVQMHSGRITFESVEGEGSRFTVVLPATAEPVEPPPAPAGSEETSGNLQHEPRLLVVDDETAICNVLQQMLRKRGIKMVDTASSVREALRKMETQAYDIAFVDLVMPEMGGMDLLKAVQAKGAKTRFVFISGQLDVSEEELVKQGASGFIYKPFTAEDLGKGLERVAETAGK